MTDTPPDDLAERGRAIFDRLRNLAEEPEADADSSEAAPGVDAEAHADADPDPDSEANAQEDPEAGSAAEPDAGPEGAPEPAGEPEPGAGSLPSGDAAPGEAVVEPPVGSTGPAPAPPSERGLPGAEDLASVARAHEARGPEPATDQGPARIEAAAEAAGSETPDDPRSVVLDEDDAEERAVFTRDLPRVMAIANQKGGVGKTTTAVNLSACLAELGYRVLVIDLDPQGNATTGLGVNPRNLQLSMYDVLLGDRELDDCIEPTSVRGLFVAPSSLDLAGAEIELVPAFSREMKLRRAIDAVRQDFDYLLIDCPPSLGLLTVNGLAAASEVVVPIQCEYYALEGLGQLLRNVTMVQQNLNPDLELAAIVLVMFDARTRLSGEVVREVRAHFGDKVCRNIVPRTVRLSEAPSFGQPIIAFDPSSRGAIAYRELAKELSGGPARAGLAT